MHPYQVERQTENVLVFGDTAKPVLSRVELLRIKWISGGGGREGGGREGGEREARGKEGLGLSLKKALLFTSIADQSCPVAAPLVGLVVQTTDSEPSLDKAMLLTIGAPPRPLSECSCIVPNICSLRAVGCKRCG